MASRFGFGALMSDSDHGSSDDEAPQTRAAPASQTQKPVQTPAMSQAESIRQMQAQAQAMSLSNGGGGDGFSAVSKKKAHHTKVSADVAKKAGVQNTAIQELQGLANGHASPKAMNGNGVVKSPVRSPQRLDGGHAARTAASPQVSAEKKKKKGFNRFACLDDDEEASGAEEEEDHDSYVSSAQTLAPVLPKDIGLTHSNAGGVPDYFGVTTLVSNEPVDPKDHKFKKEVLLFKTLFVSTKSKKVEYEFNRLVQPIEQKGGVTKTTTELTGLTNEKLKTAQPLDEVMRQFEGFLKEKNLVSANRNNKKKASANFSERELTFSLVTFGTSTINDDLRKELARKGLSATSSFKKWLDIQSLFTEMYSMAPKSSLDEILDKICLEFEGAPLVDEAKNVSKILICMLGDCPTKLVCNATGK